MFYSLLVICILLVYIGHKQKSNRKALLLFNIAVVLLILFNGLRDPFLYHDNDVYYEFFKGDHDANGDGMFNFGYFFLNIFLNVFTNNFFLFSFLVAAFVIWGYVKFIKTYSPYIGLSLILYVMINYLPSFFLLRQYLAMPFVFLSIKYIIERKQKMFLICMILAFSMHTMALSVVPLYYLYGLKYNKRDVLILLIGSIVSCVSFVIIGGFLVSFIPVYEAYMETEKVEPAWTRAITKIFIMLVFVLTLRKDCFKDGINKVAFMSMLMSVIICVGAVNLFGVYRLRDFYSLADFIGIPLIFYYLNKRRVAYKKILCIFTISYVVFLFFSYSRFVEGGNMMNSYQFYWEGTGKP